MWSKRTRTGGKQRTRQHVGRADRQSSSVMKTAEDLKSLSILGHQVKGENCFEELLSQFPIGVCSSPVSYMNTLRTPSWFCIFLRTWLCIVYTVVSLGVTIHTEISMVPNTNTPNSRHCRNPAGTQIPETRLAYILLYSTGQKSVHS